MRKSAFIAFATALLLAATLAFAQAPAGGPPPGKPMQVRGTVETLDGNTLTVKDKAGQDVAVTLAPNYKVRAVVKRSLSDIKAGDFVASTSLTGSDGKQHAVQITIFPDAMKGVVPQLQIPWDTAPDSLMTNAIVMGVAGAPDGQTLKVKYKDTETEIVVPSDIPIVTLAPGDPGLLKPGAFVVMTARKQADGTITAANVTAEKDGVKPPM
jgi:hypothetical protein